MKTKFYVLAALLMASMTNVMADETCTRIYGDENFIENKAISYSRDGTLFLSADNFSSAVVGNAIKIYGFDGEGDHTKIYLYGWEQIIPASDYRNPSNVEDNHVLFYLTEDMLSAIRSQGLRVYGEGITVNRVELCDGKAGALKFGKTIWTGYFWMDDTWSLEIFKEAFTNAGDLSKYRTMRIYYEANRTDFLMRLFTKFGSDPAEYADEDDIKLASSETTDEHMGKHAGGVTPERIYLTPTYVDIPLTETIKTYLSTNDVDHGTSLFIKCNKNGAAFNVTDVVLLPISPDGCDNCFYVY